MLSTITCNILTHVYLLFFMRTLIVSSLGQVDSVAGTGQLAPGLAEEITHWREDSEKMNEVQDLSAEFKQRLAQSIGFVSASKDLSSNCN